MDFKTRFQPFDASLKKTKRKAGQSMTFVEWVQYIIRAHTTDFPDGFSVEVRMVKEIGANVVVVMRVIDLATGAFMDGTGMAPVDKDKDNWGGAMPEAESQALRRAFAKWGMGLEMYLDEDETAQALTTVEPPKPAPSEQQVQTMKTLMWVLDEAKAVEDPIGKQATLIQNSARGYVRKQGNFAPTYEKLIPQVRKAMVDAGILPVTDIQFANALDALDMEPTNAAAQALIEQEQEDGN